LTALNADRYAKFIERLLNWQVRMLDEMISSFSIDDADCSGDEIML
jgi:hypothetical protein